MLSHVSLRLTVTGKVLSEIIQDLGAFLTLCLIYSAHPPVTPYWIHEWKIDEFI